MRPKLVIYAYALSSGMLECEKLADALGISVIEQTPAKVWEQYMKAPAYAPLEELAQEYGFDGFIGFAVNLALSAELDESVSSAVEALVGGSMTPMFAARLFASSREEAISNRSCWITSENTVDLLFSSPETLKLRPAVLHFLLNAKKRSALPRHLDKLATRVSLVFGWDDLILPETQKGLLRHICDRVRFDSAVYDDWGFGNVTPYGRGVRAMFSGPPGTGKTMAAQVVAGELGLELYRVDISSTVSKYIGETEKNIDEIFREAEKTRGILFFDEADAIFGKRGEQKDSHDKYANMQTSFLLARIEEYEGIVVLATNFASNLDHAFMRRIQVRIDFPSPDENARLAIWRALLKPSAEPDDELDTEYLAKRFELTGSQIKNIVLSAAFLAAAQGGRIDMRKILTALEMEYGKTDRILSASELSEFGH